MLAITTQLRSRFAALTCLALLALAACDGAANGGPRGRNGRSGGGDAGMGGGGGGGADAGLGGGGLGGDAGPGAELSCDGINEDRDGIVDDGCACEGDVRQACYGGDPRHAGLGACSFGSQPCVSDGEFGS